MLWIRTLNYHKIGFGTFLLAFVLLSFFLSFLNIHNSFAVDDYSVVIDQNNYNLSASIYLCGGDSGRLCSDYTYFIYNPINVSSFNPNTFFAVRYLPYNMDFYFNKNISKTIVTIDNISSLFYNNPRNFPVDVSFSFELLLSNTFPSDCPICEVCQECPAIPLNPYDDKFDKLIVAIYTCGAILLVIYFFYCIYRMIIKSTGGK